MITRLFKRWFNDPNDEDLRDFVRETRERPVHQVRVPAETPAEALPGDLAPPVGGSSPLIRNKFVREDTGTHETLKILDDSILDSGEEEGFDPYNTGDFDRSRNWERRFKS